MTNLLNNLYNDEAGFIVSAELVLVGTITVLGMIVGLSEVAININQELEDVGSAFGSINQTFRYNGTQGYKGGSLAATSMTTGITATTTAMSPATSPLLQKVIDPPKRQTGEVEPVDVFHLTSRPHRQTLSPETPQRQPNWPELPD